MFSKPAIIKGHTLADRLVGVECPVGGVDWEPDEADRRHARELLRFLKGRRLLAGFSSRESAGGIAQSARKIRKYLKDQLETGRPLHPVLEDSVRGMRAACRKFSMVIKDERNPSHSYEITPSFVFALGELRGILGLHITRIACAYDLELDIEFAAHMPLPPSE